MLHPNGVGPRENPKEAFGRAKATTFFIPALAVFKLGAVMALGARKYGPFNWRKDPIKASTYKEAIVRHLEAWIDGEEEDEESGQSHLAHVMGCAAILIDAQAHESMIDDRVKSGRVAAFLKAYVKTDSSSESKT